MKYATAALAVLLAGLVGLTATACGSGGGAESAGPVPTAVPSEAPGASTGGSGTVSTLDTGSTEAHKEVAYQVWFTRGESLFVVTRSEPATPRVGTAAVQALLEGPDSAEQAAGVGTQIPGGTQFLGLTIDKGVATVDLTSEYESGGGSASMNMRIAQVVYTLTQFPTVKGVLFKLDGSQVDVLGGEGVIVDHPVTRRDYRDLLPAILVEGPRIGESVSNPVKVFGSANVFEANVSVDVVDSSGRVVGSAFTTATCGTGCRGTFSVSVPYEVTATTHGTIVVHDDDAAGTGTPPHQVKIPVVLNPAA
jgi:Sporulation and spore germination/Immunoglobulin-like domain of bacterial spore germination